MRRAIVVALVVVAAVAAVGVATGAERRHADQPAVQGGQQVTICHATGNGGFNQITVDADSIIKGTGHGGHERDIIPPFDYVDKGEPGHYPGQNWPEGQATWENGCVVPGPPAPEPIGVFVNCVDTNSDGTFSAVFGYESANAAAVTIAAGAANNVSPDGPDRGQPTSFEPGNVGSAFTVDGVSEGGDVTWTLVYGGQTSTATASASFAEKCGGTPPEPPPAKVAIFVKCVDNASGTFSATFGYENDASEPVSVPVGPQNRFSPTPIDRGQPIEFLPGEVQAAFTVSGVADGTSLVWTVGQATVPSRRRPRPTSRTRAGSEPPPPDQPVSIFVACVTNGASTFDAEFGYLNKNGQAVTVPVGSGNRSRRRRRPRAPTWFQPVASVRRSPSPASPTVRVSSGRFRMRARRGLRRRPPASPPSAARPRRWALPSGCSSRACSTARRPTTRSSDTRTTTRAPSPFRWERTIASLPSRRIAARRRPSSRASSMPPSRSPTSRTGRASSGR